MPKYKSRVLPERGLSLFYIARAIPVIIVPSPITKYSILRSLSSGWDHSQLLRCCLDLIPKYLVSYPVAPACRGHEREP